MAQLMIDGQSYGSHPFIVQIQDLQTHEALENIYVGDTGPNLDTSMIDPVPVHESCSNTCSTMDKGYLLLNQVRIPHVSMLAKFPSVDPKTNKYIKPASTSLVYGSLTSVRSTIVLQSGGVIARGVTIASRYAAVRRQFQDRDAKEWETCENRVLDHIGR